MNTVYLLLSLVRSLYMPVADERGSTPATDPPCEAPPSTIATLPRGGRAGGRVQRALEDIRKDTWNREFKLTWREAIPLNHQDDKVDSDQ